ncbi:MAG TPA: hypothetical protein PLX55_00325 [bacterium]|jgi:hypothetical protein|nr:hypothetical protein [bacterium]
MINKNLIIATGLAMLFVAIFLVVPDIIADETIRDYSLAGPGQPAGGEGNIETPSTLPGGGSSTSQSTSPPLTSSSPTSIPPTSTQTWTSTSTRPSTRTTPHTPPGGGGVSTPKTYLPPGDPFAPPRQDPNDNDESVEAGCVGEHCLPPGSGDKPPFEDGKIDNPFITDENRAREREAQAQKLCLALMSCDDSFVNSQCTCGVGGPAVDASAPLTIYNISATTYPSNSNSHHKTTVELRFYTNKPAAVSASYQQGQQRNSNERTYKTKPNNQKNTTHTIVVGALPNAQIFNFALEAATEEERSKAEPVTVKTLRSYDNLWSLILKCFKVNF